MKPDIVTTKPKLRGVLDSKGIRYSWVADNVGISRPHLHHVMEGNRPLTRDLAERIAALLGVSLCVIGFEEGSDGTAA